MIRVERGHGAVMRVTALDGETPLTADADPVIVLTDWTGATVGDPITASAGDAPGEYKATLPAQTDLGPLTATWSFTVDDNPWSVVDVVDVVAGFYFELASLRARPGLDSTSRYPTSALVDARQYAEDLVERIVQTSFLERFHLETKPRRILCRAGTRSVALDRPYGRTLVGALVDDVPVVDAALVLGRSSVTASSWPDGTTTTIAYTAAYELAVPVDLRDAAIDAARWHLITTLGGAAIPPNAKTVQATPGGSVATGTADLDHPTGIPDIDATLLDYRRRCCPPLVA